MKKRAREVFSWLAFLFSVYELYSRFFRFYLSKIFRPKETRRAIANFNLFHQCGGFLFNRLLVKVPLADHDGNSEYGNEFHVSKHHTWTFPCDASRRTSFNACCFQVSVAVFSVNFL